MEHKKIIICAVISWLTLTSGCIISSLTHDNGITLFDYIAIFAAFPILSFGISYTIVRKMHNDKS